MMLSTNRELGEFERIRANEHIAEVWAAIQEALPAYWNRLLEREAAKRPATALATHFGAGHNSGASDPTVLTPSFAAAVEKYYKESEKYRKFFDPEAIDEFQDDPNAFKQHLSREVPVIAGTLMQRRAELREWQTHFRGARGKDLLWVFSNLLDFSEEWLEKHPEAAYARYNDAEEFGLDPVEEDEMTLPNVIGMGIKAIVLHNMDPGRLPARGRFDLYGLYFLSGMKNYGLASKTSEFLMINDREPSSNGSLIMEHNFWYPYSLYSLYVLRIYRWMDSQMRAAGSALDPQVRYVYVSHFLREVCLEHAEDMKVMRALDRFEVPL